MFYYRVGPHSIKATAFSEAVYGEDTSANILRAVMKMKPGIELDPQYEALLNDDPRWKTDPPRPGREVLAYAVSKYGPLGR